MQRTITEKVRDILFYAGLEKEQYQMIEEDILEEDRDALVAMSSIVLIPLVVLSIVQIMKNVVAISPIYYILSTAVEALILSVAIFFGKGRKKLVLFLVYSFLASLYIFSMMLGTLASSPNETATAFVAALVMAPTLFGDKPIRVICLEVFFSIAFCILAYFYKDRAVFLVDFVNCMVFSLCGIGASVWLMKIRAGRFIAIKEEKEAKKEKEIIKAWNAELEEARRKAEASDRAKTRFINNISHDIRTPLNAMMGSVYLIDKVKDDPEAISSYLKKINSSGSYLLSIVNNVLDFASIEKGSLTLDETEEDILDDDLWGLGEFREVLEKKNLSLSFSHSLEHRYVVLDRVKCRQVWSNIIGNSVKYTPQGGKIHVGITEIDSEKEGYAHFETVVSDNGIGMSEEFAARIFDEFSRERSTTESKIYGSGLGMAIVKRLLDTMGGDIKVESEKGKGTRFIIRNHWKIAEKKPEVAESGKDSLPYFTSSRVLLVEDNDINREIAHAILEERGIEVEVASDGKEALEKYEKVDAGYFGMILMDIQMPRMDGYEATKAIRSLSDKKKASIPIAAMTANAFSEDKARALSAGMDDYIPKPIDVKNMISVMAKFLK